MVKQDKLLSAYLCLEKMKELEGYPDAFYEEDINTAIECIEKLAQIEGGIADLRETMNEAYKLNDYVLDKVIKNKQITECESIAESYSLKAMQNLGWLLGVIDWSDNE